MAAQKKLFELTHAPMHPSSYTRGNMSMDGVSKLAAKIVNLIPKVCVKKKFLQYRINDMNHIVKEGKALYPRSRTR